MTRLTTEWIAGMEDTAADWNNMLQRRVGMGYMELACRVSGNSMEVMKAAASDYLVAVVPITSGLGTISAFSESVAAIVRAMGFKTIVTKAADVDGIYEAYLKGADVLYMADDDRYIALNIGNKKIGDNNIATAKGFVEALAGLSGGLAEKEVLVLGYGIIGKLMAGALTDKGAGVTVYDKDPQKQALIKRDGYACLTDAAGIKNFLYLADGTSEGPWISETMLNENAVIAAPGIPFSLDDKAKAKFSEKYVHDLLEIGTAVMMGLAI